MPSTEVTIEEWMSSLKTEKPYIISAYVQKIHRHAPNDHPQYDGYVYQFNITKEVQQSKADDIRVGLDRYGSIIYQTYEEAMSAMNEYLRGFYDSQI